LRKGLHAPALGRLALLLAGGAALFAYGCLVNAPPWDYGRLLGVYMVVFFVVAQAIAWLAFGQRPGGSMILGGTLIVIGGLIISGAQA
jgi:drug/metabolite transporter (DMT)-like permease